MCIGYMQILCHFRYGTWVSVNFGIRGRSWINHPCISRDNCICVSVCVHGHTCEHVCTCTCVSAFTCIMTTHISLHEHVCMHVSVYVKNWSHQNSSVTVECSSLKECLHSVERASRLFLVQVSMLGQGSWVTSHTSQQVAELGLKVKSAFQVPHFWKDLKIALISELSGRYFPELLISLKKILGIFINHYVHTHWLGSCQKTQGRGLGILLSW